MLIMGMGGAAVWVVGVVLSRRVVLSRGGIVLSRGWCCLRVMSNEGWSCLGGGAVQGAVTIHGGSAVQGVWSYPWDPSGGGVHWGWC